MMPGSGSETTNISSSFGNKNFSCNMSQKNNNDTIYASIETSKGTIKITTDGGTTFRHVIKDGEVPPNDTLQMDKPLNLEAGDIIRIYGDVSNMECFLSILELS